MLTIGGKDLQKRFAGTINVTDVHLGVDHIWPGTKYYAVNALAQYVTLNGQTLTNPNANWREGYHMFVFEVNNGANSYTATASADDISEGSEVQVVNCLDAYFVNTNYRFGTYKTQGAVGVLSLSATYTCTPNTVNVTGYINQSLAVANAATVQVDIVSSDVSESVLEHEIEIVHEYNYGGSGTDWISVNRLNTTVHGLPIYEMNITENNNDRTQSYGERKCKVRVYQKDNPDNYKEFSVIQNSKYGTDLPTNLVLTNPTTSELVINGELIGETRTDREVTALDTGKLKIWYYNSTLNKVTSTDAEFAQEFTPTKCHFDIDSKISAESEVMGIAHYKALPAYKTTIDTADTAQVINGLTVNWFNN